MPILVVAHHGRVKVTAVKQHGVKGPRKTSPSKRKHFALENRFRKYFNFDETSRSPHTLLIIYFSFTEADMGNYAEKVFNHCFKGSDTGTVREGYFTNFQFIVEHNYILMV